MKAIEVQTENRMTWSRSVCPTLLPPASTRRSSSPPLLSGSRHGNDGESSWARWRAQYGGMKANEAKRLRELELENARLKKLLAEAELDKSMLKELAEGNF